MSENGLTTSQFAQQHLVGTIGEGISFCNAQGLTHISPHRLFFAIINDFGYEVHRYITARLLPYEEWSEERPWTDEEEW
jgi:hypothetical protein